MKILTAAFVVPVAAPVLSDAAVVLDEDRIEAVGPREALLRQYPNEPVEDFPGCALLPGLINPHAHLELTGASELERTDQWIDWVLHLIAQRERLTPADRRAHLAEGLRQALAAGTTTIGAVGLYQGVPPIPAAWGGRLVLFPELIAGAGEKLESFEGALAVADEIQARQNQRLGAGLAPFSPYTLSRHLLKIVARYAAAAGLPLAIHAAESFAEMQFFYESTGEVADKLFPALGWAGQLPPPHRKTPIAFLADLEFLAEKPMLVGALQASDDDVRRLAKSGATVVLAPRAQAHLQLGRPPLKKLLEAGVNVALATDSMPAIYSLSLWDEMRAAAEAARAEGFDLPAETLLRMATLGGAKGLKREGELGSLEKGKQGDLLAVALEAPADAATVVPQLVRHTTAQQIRKVFVGGAPVRHG